ncbi:MAG: chemotaxis protein CheX [Planctomycetota bacterium]|jgi:CheY-specific phosphatase CheX
MSESASMTLGMFRREFMRPFLAGLSTLFESHLGEALQTGEASINKTNRPAHELSGVITFTGTLIGRAVLNLPPEVAEKVTRSYLGLDLLPEGAVEDCIAELVNVIVGRAKSYLPQYSIVISPAMVVHGVDYEISTRKFSQSFSIPCQCSHGPLQFDVSMIDRAMIPARSANPY